MKVNKLWDQQVIDGLRGVTGTRVIDFRYNLMDINSNFIRVLTNVESASISFNAFNTVKRTATFSIREEENEPINYLNQKIQVFCTVRWSHDHVFEDFPLGIFHLSSPKRVEDGQVVRREVEAYDSTVILQEDRFDKRHTIRKGTNYVNAVISILKSAGIKNYNITSNNDVLKKDLEFEPGTSKIVAVSELLAAINYVPIFIDEYDYFTSYPYVEPSKRPIDHYYQEDEFSLIAHGMEEEVDLYSIPNRWVVTYTDVDADEEVSWTSVYTNASSKSPTSTVNRGRTIVDFRTVEEIASQSALDKYTRRIANESSQVFGKVKFQTAIMPIHGYSDMVYLENKTLSILGAYAETSWKITCEAGTLMEHEARKVVDIS